MTQISRVELLFVSAVAFIDAVHNEYDTAGLVFGLNGHANETANGTATVNFAQWVVAGGVEGNRKRYVGCETQ